MNEPDTDLFFSLESSLHRPEVRLSAQLVDDLLADGFIEFGSSGRVFNKQTMVAALAEEKESDMNPLPQVADFSVMELSNGVVLVT